MKAISLVIIIIFIRIGAKAQPATYPSSFAVGASAADGVGWSRQLTDNEAKKYTLQNIPGDCVKNYL
jgi:hypothetical protein